MAAPTTILEYVTLRRDSAQQDLTNTQTQLAAAQTAVASAITALANETALLESLNKAAAKLRQRLAVVPTPADGEPLLAALELLAIRQRASQSRISHIQEDILIAQGNMNAVQGAVSSATAALNSAEADLERAVRPSEQRDEWVTALDAEPLASMHTAATKALDPTLPEGAAFKKATERIEADIPAKLLERARKRRDAEAARIKTAADNAKKAADAVLAERNNSGFAAQADDLRATFRSVESVTSEYVGSAAARFEQATSALTAVGDEHNSPLTAEQTARIKDPALQTDREAAVDEEEAVDAKRKDLEDKQKLLDDAVVAAKADPTNATKAQDVLDAQDDVDTARVAYFVAHDAWVDKLSDYIAAIHDVEEKVKLVNAARQAAIAAGADPETDADVLAAKSDLTNAEQALKQAEDDYKASPHGILHAWQVAVPDSTWRLFERYEQAKQTLTRLQNPAAAAVKLGLKTAETNYLTAQLKADASASVLSQLTAEQIRRTTREGAVRETATARLLSALRGDD